MKKFNILLFITVIILLLLSGWSIFHQPGYSRLSQIRDRTKSSISFYKHRYSSAIDLQCSAIVRLHCCEMEKTPHQTGRIRRDPNRIQPEFTRYVY